MNDEQRRLEGRGYESCVILLKGHVTLWDGVERSAICC
jgi:hypothetical protein